MVNRKTGRLILSLIFFLAISSVFAQTPSTAPVKDSSGSVKAKSPADEELILDAGDNALVPSAPKAQPAAAVASDNSTSAPAKSTTTAPAPAATAPAAPKDTLKKAQDEDLILEGGEDNLLDRAKIAQKKATEAKKRAADSAGKAARSQAAVPAATTDSTNKIPTPATVAGDTTGKIPTPSAAAAAAASAPVVPTPVENERSVNFAKNLKEYRSPKLAMLMSLILPGAGQVYAKANLWAAGFALIEAGIITGGVTLANKASRIKKQAYTYADQHYDATKFKNYHDSLKVWVSNPNNVFNRAVDKDSNGNVIPDSVIQRNLLNQTIFTSADEVQQFLNDAQSKNDNYYNTINRGVSPYIRGWKDVTPPDSNFTGNGWNLDTSVYGTGSGNSGYLIYPKSLAKSGDTAFSYGQSDNFKTYSGIMKTSLDWSNRSRNVFFTLLINHIVSAVMAGFEAQQHNDQLLGKESYLDHLNVQMDYVNTGSETVPAYYLAVKF